MKQGKYTYPHQVVKNLLIECGDRRHKLLNDEKIDYKIFKSETMNGLVLYIEGSNEPSDWAVNLMGFLSFPFYSLGYFLKSIRLKKLIDKNLAGQPYVLVGYSYGAAVVSVYVARYIRSKLKKRKDKGFRGALAIAPPVCFGHLNPKRPKDLTVYLKPDDFVNYSKVLFLRYRFPKRPYRLQKTGSDLIQGHMLSAYIKALDKEV